MADYYQQCSLTIAQLSKEEIDWLKDHLVQVDGEDLFLEDPEEPENEEQDQKILELRERLKDILTSSDEMWPDFEYKFEKGSFPNEDAKDYVWFSSENGGSDQIARLCRAFLAKFRPNQVVYFGWADTCNKMRAGAFGGGAYIITKEQIQVIYPYAQFEEFMRKHPDLKRVPNIDE